MSGPQPERIRDLFSSVAPGYDLANDAMTFGLARRWRKVLVHWSGVRHGESVLDCATGTGDLAFDFKRVVGPEGRVVGTDFCDQMLKVAVEKAQRKKLGVEFIQADAMRLPFDDNAFDVTSIAYGIRNVADPITTLAEMARATKSKGRVMILETGDTPSPTLKPFINFYFKKIVPRVGGWLTGQRQAYEYLTSSSQAFPSREDFVEIMLSTGLFESVQYRALMGGASFVYNGKVK
ncbi:MAG: bifunctional demethylmenaquinone methyltransferase/2-methoxy-6-polyprenyl-1,4-benzoquinol methylase UbiE [Bdellovibrionales bacterium]